MLTANRIKQLQNEIDELKRKSANSKNIIKMVFTDNYSIDMSKYDEEVISTDYLNTTDEVNEYRPDEELEIILEMKTKYIHISYKLINRHSDIETRVSITEDKNITTDLCDNYDKFNEVFLDDLEKCGVRNHLCLKEKESASADCPQHKYNLTDFETNLITAILNEPIEDSTFISDLGSNDESKESEGESGEDNE